jgi:hypothetical protein
MLPSSSSLAWKFSARKRKDEAAKRRREESNQLPRD